MLNVGDTVPDFELLSDEGRLVKLSDFRGQKVILFFYPNLDKPEPKRVQKLSEINKLCKLPQLPLAI